MADLREQLQSTLGDSLILEHELGGGGMSRVFVAHDSALGRKVVVKVLPHELAGGVNIDRFRREIQLAAQLQHPHIVPLLSAGETNGLPYYTMPYVRGESLRVRLSKGELPIAEAVHVLREISTALAYAHEAGVVHRDIKPENVLISGGSAVVTDFGVAKALTISSGESPGSLTSTEVALGTPAYMAPEQAAADPHVDHRADIYSLGVVAYELLCGSTPFPGRPPQATLAAHVSERPEPIRQRRSTIPNQLATLVMRCLEKRPADRPQSAMDVIHEIDALSTPSGGIEPTAAMARARSRSSMRMWGAIGVAAAVLIGVVGFVFARTKRADESAPTSTIIPAIAVLPFDNLGRKEGQEFTDGMTEEITNRLASLRGLRVIGRQSAKNYAGTRKTPQQIAAELGVKYVLTGTVRWDRSADGKDIVRVSPALVRTDDATQLWSQPYESVLAGMFEIQSRVANEVANALDVKLLAPEKIALQKTPTDNVEAYALYLRGNELLENTDRRDKVRNAVEFLEKATIADPNFALAFAKLGMANVDMYWYNWDRSSKRLAIAKRAIDRAAQIDPQLPDVHVSRAFYHYHGFNDYPMALRELDIAERMRPNDYYVMFVKGAIQRRQGNWQESVVSMKRAIELEPRNAFFLEDLANTLRFLRRYAEMEELADRLLVINPDGLYGPDKKISAAIERRGNLKEAIAHLRAALTNVASPSARMDFLWTNMSVAVQDPNLTRVLLDAPYVPDRGSKTPFFLRKARLHYYLDDTVRSHSYADSALVSSRVDIQRAPQEWGYHANMGIAYSYLGRREECMKALDRAEEIFPLSRDVWIAPDRRLGRAIAYITLGDQEAAISILERSLNEYGGVTKERLRVLPIYNPLRSNPRFQRLIQN